MDMSFSATWGCPVPHNNCCVGTWISEGVFSGLTKWHILRKNYCYHFEGGLTEVHYAMLGTFQWVGGAKTSSFTGGPHFKVLGASSPRGAFFYLATTSFSVNPLVSFSENDCDFCSKSKCAVQMIKTNFYFFITSNLSNWNHLDICHWYGLFFWFIIPLDKSFPLCCIFYWHVNSWIAIHWKKIIAGV